MLVRGPACVAVTGGAGAGPGREEHLQLADDSVKAQADAVSFGDLFSRCRVQKAWATETRATWWCQPGQVCPSKWPGQGPDSTAVVVLDAPAAHRGTHEDGQRRGLGQVGEPELHGLVLVGGPLGQQPAGRKLCGGRGLADLTPSGPDPQSHDTKREYMRLNQLRPLPGRDPSLHCTGRAEDLPAAMTRLFTCRGRGPWVPGLCGGRDGNAPT